MKTGIILGTRPEIIKMSPIIREYQKQSEEFIIIHTGQHYNYELDKAFFLDLELPDPEYNLNVGSGTHAVQTSKIMTGVENVLQKEKCDIILVQGDTNTVLAAALVASKLGIKVGHVEAGLRSYDRTMPEEINRVLTDHVSDFLFAPTDLAKKNLQNEGISENTIHVTGNTVVDAVYQNKEIAEKNRNPLSEYELAPGEYFLVTIHRAENTDNPERLRGIIQSLDEISRLYNQKILFPIHPRTAKMLNNYDIKTTGVEIIKPVGYLDFLVLESNARLILTDSGGIQEEACILKVPCVTLRNNTERPETILNGANILVGTEPRKILEGIKKMLTISLNWKNPFGDGMSANRIIKILQSYF